MIALLGSKVRVKVSSVKGIRDSEGRENLRIEFVEVREKPPILISTPIDVPKQVGKMMIQISKGIQQSIPGGTRKQYEIHKITFIFTLEDLEAFKLKPYPNQLYELSISKGNVSFKKVS